MTLAIPTLVGPVSELTATLRVQGAMSGALVVVASIGPKPRVVASHPAGGGDDRLPLLTALIAGDLLVVHQELGAEKSSATATGMALGVQHAPTSVAELGYLGMYTHVYECGQYVWITGAVPGARVEVTFGGPVQAAGAAEEGEARLALPVPIPHGGAIDVYQVPPVGPGPVAALPADPLPPGPLPAPTVNPPLVGCQTAVLVSGVFDGATVTFQMTKSGVQETGGFDLPALWFPVPPLKAGDGAHAIQTFPRCNLLSTTNPDVPVGPPATDPPLLIGPLCAGASSVVVANYSPGAVLTVQVDTTQYRVTPPAAGSYTVQVDPLPAGKDVKVQQAICGATSPWSPPLTINAHEAVTIPVTVIEPLYACARAVFVSEYHTGCLLQAMALHGSVLAPISAVIRVGETSGYAKIPVTPFLREGDQVIVREWACSTTPLDSAPAAVKPHPSPALPAIASAPAHGTLLTVRGAVAGALVEVYLQDTSNSPWHFIGSQIADQALDVLVHTTVRLPFGGLVRARQTICGTQTEFGPAQTVVRGVPGTPLLDRPADQATGQSLRPNFSWHDAYPDDDRHADSYSIRIIEQPTYTIVLDWQKVTGATSYAPGFDLKPNTDYLWYVFATNATGSSGDAGAGFATAATPAPVPPVLSGYNTSTRTLTGSGFLANKDVWVLVNVSGSVLLSDGTVVQDPGRVSPAQVRCTSDASGNLSAIVDPKTAVPPLYLGIGGYQAGAAPGETVKFSAHDSRMAGSDFLYSNTLPVTWP